MLHTGKHHQHRFSKAMPSVPGSEDTDNSQELRVEVVKEVLAAAASFAQGRLAPHALDEQQAVFVVNSSTAMLGKLPSTGESPCDPCDVELALSTIRQIYTVLRKSARAIPPGIPTAPTWDMVDACSAVLDSVPGAWPHMTATTRQWTLQHARHHLSELFKRRPSVEADAAEAPEQACAGAQDLPRLRC
jgi:hypothetical protein